MTRDVSDVTHRKRGLRFEKSQLRSCLRRRRLTFASSPWPCVGCAHGLGQMEKSGVSLSLYWKTFKLKGNKKFRAWTKKSSSVFCLSGFLCSMLSIYELWTFYVHFPYFEWLCNISTSSFYISCFYEIVVGILAACHWSHCFAPSMYNKNFRNFLFKNFLTMINSWNNQTFS